MRTLLPLLSCILFINVLSAQIFEERSQEIGFDHEFRDRSLMGGGAAFFDYENDGDDDFYITGGFNKDDIYRNNGDGTYTKILDDIGINVTSSYNTMGVATGDIDNDGDRDIFVTTWEEFAGADQPIARSLLFRQNNDGTFSEIGETAGITHKAFGMGASFMDYNKDGFLDIYVMNHIEEAIYTYDMNGAIDGFAHTCYPNYMYRNNGDFTFTEVSEQLGVNSLACTIAAVPSDYDMDGDLDLYLANDFGVFLTPNELFQNDMDNGTFLDVSEVSKANVQAFGMGIASGDYDHDGDFDYYTTNIGRNILVENTNGEFEDVTTYANVENAIVPGEGNTTGWGTAFFDVDNDSWEDLYVANGRIPTLAAYATAMDDPDKLYLNNKDKTFTDVSESAGVADKSYCHGMAYSDYDSDGDLDIVVVALDELGAHSKFYVNETQNDNHFAQFKLIGKESNRDAYGSKIWVYADNLTLVKELYGGGASHASQHTSIMHFGLADKEIIDSIKIQWTNGHIDVIESLEVDQLHTLTEGTVSSNNNILSQNIDVAVSPNPFDNYLKIQSFVQDGLLGLQLFSIDGRILDHIELEKKREINYSPPLFLESGIYILRINTINGWVNQRIVKR